MIGYSKSPHQSHCVSMNFAYCSSVVSSTMKSAVSAKSSVVGKRPWPEEVSEVPLPPKRPAPAVPLDADMMEEGGHGGGKINRPVSPRFSTAMSPRYPPV